MYEVDVTCATHTARHPGVVSRPRVPGADTWRRVHIPGRAVRSDREAVELAARIVSRGGGTPTSAVLVGWPDEV